MAWIGLPTNSPVWGKKTANYPKKMDKDVVKAENGQERFSSNWKQPVIQLKISTKALRRQSLLET